MFEWEPSIFYETPPMSARSIPSFSSFYWYSVGQMLSVRILPPYMWSFFFQNLLNSLSYSLDIYVPRWKSLLFRVSTLLVSRASSTIGLNPSIGGKFFHLWIKVPVSITSSPGLHDSISVFCRITGIDLGMSPGFKVLKVSCTLISW